MQKEEDRERGEGGDKIKEREIGRLKSWQETEVKFSRFNSDIKRASKRQWRPLKVWPDRVAFLALWCSRKYPIWSHLLSKKEKV